MPYSLKGNCVYKGEEQLKCYDNHSDALAYFRALQANVENSLHEFSMVISKSSLNNGEMRWSAVNSDTEWDLYGERMSLELFKSMLGKIKANQAPPEPFNEVVTSDFWTGGMPYLSIAHYLDGNGRAVPGDVRELFIDGIQLKARGTLHDNKLGKAVWKKLKQDELNYKAGVDADRTRISIAFLDLAHKHGEDGKVFERKSFTDVCPECQRGVGEKIYLDGYLVHLALTTVPVNPRTIMEAEDVMARKAKPETRIEDAVAVLGGEEGLADEVAKSALEVKSDVLVEMSETPAEESQPEVTEPVSEEKLEVSKSELVDLVSQMVERAMDEKKKKPADEEDMEGKPKVEKKSDAVSTPVQKSALEISVDKLYNTINEVVAKSASADEKLQVIQPVLEEVGQEILAVVKSSVGESQPAPVPANDAILEAIQNLNTKIDTIGTEVATLKAQTLVSPAQQNRVPVPRSIPATVVKSDVPAQQTTPANPNSVRNIVRRSVGFHE